MRLVSQHTADAWRTGAFVDRARPMARVTIQQMPNIPIREMRETRPFHRDKVYSSVVLGVPTAPIELPNVRSVEWNRGIDTDVASCTITLWNNKPLEIGELPHEGHFDQPGFYSPRRGVSPFWPHEVNEWRNILVPDRLIRTYQGYGYDFSVIPELDPFMYETGVWIIDEVSFNTDQTIRITCRDVGRLLLDHFLTEPVVPTGSLPLKFFCVGDWTDSDVLDATWVQLTAYQHNSNEPWMGGNHLPVNGHYPADSADASMDTYWLSFGNAEPNAGYSYEWVQFGYSGMLNAVKLSTVGTGYTVFVSLWNGSQWVGDKKVPYDPNHWASYPNDSDQMYVHSWIQSSETMEVLLPQAYTGITAVRFTFTNLWHSGFRAASTAVGGRFPYRAAVRMAHVAGTAVLSSAGTPIPGTGNITDYSDVVAELVSYVFAWWPDAASGANYKMLSDGTIEYHTPRPPIPGSIQANMGLGDYWGMIEQSGTCPIADLTEEIFHAKSIMEGVTYVKEVLGFNFFVDEHGGVVFRSPNLFTHGNYVDVGIETVDPVSGSIVEPYGYYQPVYESAVVTDNRIVIFEEQSLLSYEETLSSRNSREIVVVGNKDGAMSAQTDVFTITGSGNVWGTPFRRLAQWTDQHFGDIAEVTNMAEMICKRIIASSTSARMRIPAHPGLQVDDQIWIAESVTATYDLHYVRSISSSWDAERGYWFYDLETNRLVL